MANNRRECERHRIEIKVDIITTQSAFTGDLNDLSAAGASISRDILDEKIIITDDELINITIDGFGDLSGSVVREWDDGLAVQFVIDDDDKYSLQEDLDAFRRENDLTLD